MCVHAHVHGIYDPSNALIYGCNKLASRRKIGPGGLDKHQAQAYSEHKSTTERSRVRHKLSCSRCTCDSLPMRGRRRGNARFSNPEANLHDRRRIKVIIFEKEKKERHFYIVTFILCSFLLYRATRACT